MQEEYKVCLTTVREVNPHTNAERLEVCTVYGFQVITQKGKYKVGDMAIYIPIDSILPSWLETRIFPEDSKVKLHHHRVRQIKLRGLASQGMLIDPAELADRIPKPKLEQDIKDKLEINKYEPPAPQFAQTVGGAKQKVRRQEHPLFHKYNGLNNIKWFPDLFKEGDAVVVQEKLHGTNARAAIQPYNANTLLKKIMRLIGLAPKYARCYGSNNVDISAKGTHGGYYGSDIYGAIFEKMDIFDKLLPGETVYGEIVGPGIQKNYDYGLKEHNFFLFDVKCTREDGTQYYLSPAEVLQYARDRDFRLVPVIYCGSYEKELMYTLTKGPSLLDPNQKVREGIVIKALTDYASNGNKKAVKWISEDFLNDSKNTDFH